MLPGVLRCAGSTEDDGGLVDGDLLRPVGVAPGERVRDPVAALDAGEVAVVDEFAAQEGEVVAAGSGIRAEDGKVTPLDVKAGDRILFGKWSGTEVKVDGEELLIMKESDILGIVA